MVKSRLQITKTVTYLAAQLSEYNIKVGALCHHNYTEQSNTLLIKCGLNLQKNQF